uniref:Uncharacterized protein n=1 Tax=Musa acuminata subsp. malaccensis TaxID=214687 RepID=A0A804JK26_MUSAM
MGCPGLELRTSRME